MHNNTMIEGKTERFQLLLEPSLVNEIDNWGWSMRVRTRAEAIRSLVRIGLGATPAENEKADAQRAS